jgi:hypothetical protein
MSRKPSYALLACEPPAEVWRTAISFKFRATRDAQKTPGELVNVHPNAIIVDDDHTVIRFAQALTKDLYKGRICIIGVLD